MDWLLRESCSDSIFLKLILHRYECFTGRYATRKIETKPHPGNQWRIFRILSLVRISMILLISNLSLKLFLNKDDFRRTFEQ